MPPTKRSTDPVRGYAVALALCALALALGLWNGFARGHWFSVGLLAVTVIAANLAIRLRKELRKRQA